MFQSGIDAEEFRREVLRIHGPKCAICGIVEPKPTPSTEPRRPGGLRAPTPIPRVVQFRADHKVALWAGGTNDPAKNGQVLCAKCHQEKTDAEANERARLNRQTETERVLRTLQFARFRLGASLRQLHDATGLGQGLLRSCLKDLIADGRVEQPKLRGPYRAVAPRPAEPPETESDLETEASEWGRAA